MTATIPSFASHREHVHPAKVPDDRIEHWQRYYESVGAVQASKAMPRFYQRVKRHGGGRRPVPVVRVELDGTERRFASCSEAATASRVDGGNIVKAVRFGWLLGGYYWRGG